MPYRQQPVVIRINGHEETIDLDSELSIDEDSLQSEFSQQPAKFAFFANIYVEHDMEAKRIKNELAEYEAAIERDIRQQVAKELMQGERITEAKVAAAYQRDKTWQELTAKLTDAEGRSRHLEVVKDAFRQRGQMLWAHAMTRRQEMSQTVSDRF